MSHHERHKLPPRVPSLHKPRWMPAVVREWAMQRGEPLGEPRRRGRPRNPV
jgi:hypothetical protein